MLVSSSTSRRRPSVFPTACAFIFLSALLGAQTAIPDGLYLKLNEGSGTSTANAAVPGTLAGPFLTTIASWVNPPAAPYLGNSAYLTPIFGTGQPLLQSGSPYSFSPAWTIEFAVDLLSGPTPIAGFATSVIDDPFINFNISVTPRGNGQWDITGTVPTIGGFISIASFTSSQFTPTTPWTFVSISYDPSTGNVDIYRNGVLDTSTLIGPVVTISITSGNPAGFTIGNTSNIIPIAIPSVPIDEMRIWNSARTAGEIAANFANELDAQVGGLTTSSNAVLTFNPVTNTFTASGTITGILIDGGTTITNPSADAIIGAPFTITGTYSGVDLGTYSDIVLAPASIGLRGASTADTLTISSIFGVGLGPGPFFELGGALGVLPLATYPFSSPINPTTTRLGSGSTALDRLATRLSNGSSIAIVVSGSGTTPSIRSLDVDFQSPLVVLSRGVATNGSGAFGLGIIGCPANGLIYNVFAPNPTTGVGGGQFFGVQFSEFTLVQINAPIPTNPFRVLPNANGNYFFGVPNGTLPAGLIVDTVTIIVDRINPAILYTSGATRLVF